MKLAVLLASAAAAARAATFYVTIAGLGGQADFDQRFAGWAKDIDKTLKTDSTAQVETIYGPAATRDRVRDVLTGIAKRATAQDSLVVMLIGHGTYDGRDYKFALPGPDVSGAELAKLLDAAPAGRQLVVNMTSSSGASIEGLSRPNRVVIAATKAGTERNATVFARYWVEALRDPAADADKNEAISALEAFKYAERKTARFYEDQQRLATEHPRIEGQVASMFPLVRFGQAGAALNDPAKRALLARKDAIELEIDKLKLEKAAMPTEEYRKKLTALLLDLAKVQEELDK